MRLNFKSIGEGKPLIILHGLFGSLDNWITVGRSFSEFREVFLVDQRNHGLSPNDEEFSYQVLADDLADFIETHHIKNPAILGHSMGGKVAMKFAIQHTNIWDKLIVVDIAPKYYPVHHRELIDAMKSLDLGTLTSRKDADNILAERIRNVTERQFLLKNLQRMDGGGYQWKVNLAVIDKKIENLSEGIEEPLATEKDVLFIRGKDSDYIKDSDIILINQLFPNVQVETIENAGHWVHTDQPQKLFDVVTDFLKN